MIGELIAYIRTEKNVSQDALCRGLCSRTFLARVETGERRCERILMEALLQRVGVASDRFVFIADTEEQTWLSLREMMYKAVDMGDKEKADAFFLEYGKYAKKKSRLHKQLLMLYKAVLGWKTGMQKGEILAVLLEAWAISQPNSHIEKMNVGLTMAEVSIAMMYARVREDAGENKEARFLYESILQHLDIYADERDSAKLYPQIAYRLVQIYIKSGEIDKAVLLAIRCINLLRREAKLHYLRLFLEIILQYGTLSSHEHSVAMEICNSIRWLYEHNEIEEQRWEWDISFTMSECNLYGEALKARREMLGMSQETISEGVCDPVTVSRIERGKSSPKRTAFLGLMKKIGLVGGGHETEFSINQPALWKLETDINRLLNQARGEEAEVLIDNLEKRLLKPSNYEKQFLLKSKALAWGNQDKIKLELKRNMYREALYLTIPNKPVEELKTWYFSMAEVSCVNSLAQAEDRLGNGEKYIELLYAIKYQYEGKFLGLQHYARGYELTCLTLGDLLGNAGRYEEGIDVERDGIKIALKCGLEAILCSALYDCGWNMEHLWEKNELTRKESLCYMKASYSLELLFGREKDIEAIKNHIELMYG